MKVEEITVGEAFQRCRPPRLRNKPSKEKTAFCVTCDKKIDKITVINDKVGVCLGCGFVIFDFRGTKAIGTPLDDETEAIRRVIKTYGEKHK